MLELSFDMGINKSTSQEQWQCKVDKDGVRILYVPDKSSKYLPTLEKRRFRCIAGREVFVAEGGRFKIVTVDLREVLEPLEPLEPLEVAQAKKRLQPDRYFGRNRPSKVRIRLGATR